MSDEELASIIPMVWAGWRGVPLGAGVECAVQHDAVGSPVFPHPAELTLHVPGNPMALPLCRAHSVVVHTNSVDAIVAITPSMEREGSALDDFCPETGIAGLVEDVVADLQDDRPDESDRGCSFYFHGHVLVCGDAGDGNSYSFPSADPLVEASTFVPADEVAEGMLVVVRNEGWVRVVRVAESAAGGKLLEFQDGRWPKQAYVPFSVLVAVHADPRGEPWVGQVA